MRVRAALLLICCASAAAHAEPVGDGSSFELPPAYFDELPFPRPYEFLPAAIFAGTLVGYWDKGEWRNDFFEHGMVLALTLGLLSELTMAFSRDLYDPLLTLAHVGRLE